jgi:NitT/TauT family transport system substrate-binding protein
MFRKERMMMRHVLPSIRGKYLAIAGFAVLTLFVQFVPPTRAIAQSETGLRVITTPIDNSAGVEYAQALGFFKKYGLSVQIQVMNSGEAAAAAVAGGAADIGVANTLSLAIAHQKGIGLTLLAPAGVYVNSEPTIALVVAGDAPISSAKELSGKTIAVPAINDLNTISAELWLDKNGGNSKSVKFIELPTPQMATAVQSHVVDAAMIATPQLALALAHGVRILGLPYGAVASKFSINGWYAKKDWLANHRDEAKRFALAVGEAQLWANSNHAASGKILAEVSKIDPLVLTKMTRATYADRFEPDLLQPVIDLAARYHVISESFPATDLYENLP